MYVFSQDSSRECESAVSTATAEPSSNRRRAKSAPAPRADLAKLDEQPLPASQPVSPLDRDFGDAVSPFKAPDVSMIKLEPDICRMGPLPDDQPPQPFCQTDAAGGGGAYSLDSKQPIKEEIIEGGGGGDFELDSMDKLENLIFDCNFTRDFSDEIRLKRSPSSSSASDRLGNQLHDEACGGRGGLLSVDDDGDAFAAAVAASNPATTSPAYVRTSPMLHLSPPPSQQQLNANSSFPCSPNFASSPLASPSLTAAATARLELSGRETMSLMKLEMSFENSNSSLPQMSPETESIWTTVMLSCDLASLQNHLTTSLLRYINIKLIFFLSQRGNSPHPELWHIQLKWLAPLPGKSCIRDCLNQFLFKFHRSCFLNIDFKNLFDPPTLVKHQSSVASCYQSAILTGKIFDKADKASSVVLTNALLYN